MPEQGFYITDDDRIRLFEYITLRSGDLIPSQSYSKPEYKHVCSSKDFISTIELEAVSFFIISKEFTNEPLIIERNEYSNEPAYLIIQRTGGPYVTLSCYRGFADDSVIQHKRTNIHHYPRYIHYDSTEEFKATDELKAYYKMLCKFLRSLCQVVERNGKKYYVSKSLDPEEV